MYIPYFSLSTPFSPETKQRPFLLGSMGVSSIFLADMFSIYPNQRKTCFLWPGYEGWVYKSPCPHKAFAMLSFFWLAMHIQTCSQSHWQFQLINQNVSSKIFWKACWDNILRKCGKFLQFEKVCAAAASLHIKFSMAKYFFHTVHWHLPFLDYHPCVR